MRQTDRDLRLFVTERNINHFKSVLAGESDTGRREILASLLAAAESELEKIKAQPSCIKVETNAPRTAAVQAVSPDAGAQPGRNGT
jgi:predicted RNA-binding protein with EMAP domain